jgi:glycosyltransferase involved in cell wall biosynthesis
MPSGGRVFSGGPGSEARSRLIEQAGKEREPSANPSVIRVAINAITDLSQGYGAHVYLLNLARELSKSPSVDLTLLIREGQKASLPDDLREVARKIAMPGDRSYWQMIFQNRISDFLIRESIDIYHLPYTLPFAQKVVPTVVTIHDLADLRIRKYGWPRTLYRWGINYCAAQLADRVLTVSENSKTDIVRLLRVPKEKVHAIYNGVDASFRVLDREACARRVEEAYSISRSFILAPGGLSRNKNTGTLLKAFARLKASGMPHLLVLTGGGEGKDVRGVRSEIQKLRLERDAILTGYVPASDMPALYNACCLVAYPTLYEGFGLPVLEAMACGAPVITSNVSSLPELAGDAALLIDPRSPEELFEAMSRVIRECDVRETLLQRGLDRVHRFSWRATAEQTVQVYRESIGMKVTGEKGA